MIERPETGAPRLAWMVYVVERVAPILAARDADFAALAKREEPVVTAARVLLGSDREAGTAVVDPAWVERSLGMLLARAQAVFSVKAWAGSGDAELLAAVDAAFAPHSLLPGRGKTWVQGSRASRWISDLTRSSSTIRIYL